MVLEISAIYEEDVRDSQSAKGSVIKTATLPTQATIVTIFTAMLPLGNHYTSATINIMIHSSPWATLV